MEENILKVSGITKTFGGVTALSDVSMEIRKGEIHCLAGENGCGKSTLIKIVSGFYKPDCGTIEINGKEHTQMSPIESLKEGIQVIYQDFSIFPNLTVAENVAMSSVLINGEKRVSKKKMWETAKTALDRIGADIPLNKDVELLSVAEKQLVAIARSIIFNAKLIIMDEPTASLTRKEVEALFNVIHALKAEGISIAFVSHKLEEIFEICDRITILSNGKNVISGDISEFDKKKIVYYMTGRNYNDERLAQPPQDADPILEVNGLTREHAFKDISFKLYPGEVLGITGLLGSGRTELAQALSGMGSITSGEIILCGRKIKMRSMQDGLKNKIGYVPEDRLTEGLFLDQSITDNIVISNLQNYVSGIGFLKNSDIETCSHKWVEELAIKTDDPSNAANTLSGGNQQKIVLAKEMEVGPKLLILNAPTVGVDIGSKMDIFILIQKIAAQGVGVILISDDSMEILSNCKRILMMKKGSIVGEFDNADFTEESLYEELIS